MFPKSLGVPWDSAGTLVFKVKTDLLDCAIEIIVSVPANTNTFFIHLVTKEGTTCL